MSSFQRKIGAERSILMFPFNVVMVARVRGSLNESQIASALERLRDRHALLAVRVHFDEDGTGWFIGDDVPAVPVETEVRADDARWMSRVQSEYRKPFPIETGPLFRCSLIHSEEVSELVLCGHHMICDGMSMGWLIRDLLTAVADPDMPIEELPPPPPIDDSTVPDPPKTGALARWITGLINRKWERKNLTFNEQDMLRLHERFWEENDRTSLVAWEMDEQATDALARRSREEGVTINSALWAAFLSAQHETQTDRKPYHPHSGLAINTRDRLNVPVGEALGFFASSLTVDLPYDPSVSFWDNARDVHARIDRELTKTNLFRMLAANALHPTLLDSLYFVKYGLLDGKLQHKLLRKMGFHTVTYGCALTNVGRLDIPTRYGPLELEAVYGPSIFSDVEEKVIGVITVGGRLSVTLLCNEKVTEPGVAERLKNAAMGILLRETR